jgi:hypothetical protein
MSLVDLTLKDASTKGYEYTETIATGADGDTIRIPLLGPGNPEITCTLVAGANTGKFQISTDIDSIIAADTAIEWQDWDVGDSTGTITRVWKAPVSAIRGVSVSGEINITVRI